ncbi:PIN domain-containing protein [Candidatus Woesearchaeota archaeon]|nr:PIN domain-containing protein [Candidatus Woesearchaeota archaeon]
MKVLDTDIFIDLFRGVPSAAVFIKEHADDIAFSSITEGELLSGRICNDRLEQERVIHLLSRFEKIPVDNPLIQVAASIRRAHGLELPDAIIAASALLLDATLVTRNSKDFKSVEHLGIHEPY